MSSNFSGFDELMNRLETMQKAAEELEGTHTVNFEELFTSNFMESYTQHASFDEFLQAGGFIVNSQEDFESIPDEEFNTYVSSASSFDSWEEMQAAAVETYVSKKLGF